MTELALTAQQRRGETQRAWEWVNPAIDEQKRATAPVDMGKSDPVLTPQYARAGVAFEEDCGR